MNAKMSGQEGGGSKNTSPVTTGRVTRRPDPLGVLSEVVLDLTRLIEGLLEEGPDPARVDLRLHRYRLYEAFPRLKPSDSDLAQALAEADGDEIE